MVDSPPLVIEPRSLMEELGVNGSNVPSLTGSLRYGSETWTKRSQEKRRLEAVQMYFMRSLVGKTRRDRVRNQDANYQKQWKDHVMRMPPCRLPKVAMFYKADGTREDDHEDDGVTNTTDSVSLGTGHWPIPWKEEEEEEEEEDHLFRKRSQY
ncbi:hypothetical protein C0J52_27097 [Blattella germanica]|nr:hypothetical protein C0J52_27097 [Blattella germanica]